MSARRAPDCSWRTQAVMLEEGTYEFEVEAVDGDDDAGYVLSLCVAHGPLHGHRIRVREGAEAAGVRAAIGAGRRFRLRATIKTLRGRGTRLVNPVLV